MFEKTCLVCSSKYDSTKNILTSPEDETKETDDSAIITETLLTSVLQLPDNKTTKSKPEGYDIWTCQSCSSQIRTLYKLLEKLKIIQKECEDNKERLLESVISSVIKSCANNNLSNNKNSHSSLKQVVSFLPRVSVEYQIYKKWNGRCKKEFSKLSESIEVESSEPSSFLSTSSCDSIANETSCSYNEDHCYSSSSTRRTRKAKLHEPMSSCHSTDDDERNLKKGTKSKSFICPQSACNFGCQRFESLKQHLNKKHTQSAFNSCDNCEKIFQGTEISTEHNCSFSKLCHGCGESYTSKQLFQAHIQGKKCSKAQDSRKTAKKDLYQCNYQSCTKTFTNKQSLFYHVTSHTGEKPFKCKFKSCPKSFINQTQLNIHFSSVHTKERNYICQQCGFRVSSLSGLSSHLKTHSKSKPFKCNHCEKCFRSKTHLAKHQLIHSGIKPYSCSQCNRAFNRKENLKSHLYTHEKLKPHACTFCPVSFSRAGLLKKHVQDRHSDSMVNVSSTLNIHGNTTSITNNLVSSNQGQKETIICFDNNNAEGVVSGESSSSTIMPKEIVSILCNIPNPHPPMEFTTTTTTNETENPLEETLFFTSSNGGQYIILKEVSE